ncbi:senescence-associated protein (macronuclear) [Tetrahymena thermophila SB210]|uniref:Senescence-associated protein n=1 Tax=Tetrahymena thermophila (strain SB210) TaxID=312017 RepID=Q23CJ2_TETTS|nr:senescence-associated protein [Tetrahymena thermophila SB210]EAR94288.1 senescence-associated protein [Tetrahymena thermophila SB210]|eukprot:XP_001014533.1 senescence-associated protein [Tetrahymena thermophila SB210]
MDSQFNSADLLFEVQNCTLYDVTNEKAIFIHNSPIAVYEIKEQKIVFIKMNNWEYCFQKEIPVLKQIVYEQIMYIFPSMAGNYGLLFQRGVNQDLVDLFENFLENNSDFVVGTTEKQMVEDSSDSSSDDDDQVQCNQQNQNQNQQPKSNEKKQLRGEKIRNGLINLGERVAKRIEKRKERIINRISRPRYIQIRPETLERIRKLRIFSDRIFKVSKDVLNGMINVSKKIMSKLANKIGDTKIGKRIKKNRVYCDFKEALKNGIKSIAAVYDGMIEAKHLVQLALQDAVTGIVAAKYGEQAGQLTNDLLGIRMNYQQMHHIEQYVKQDQAKQIIGVEAHHHHQNGNHSQPSHQNHNSNQQNYNQLNQMNNQHGINIHNQHPANNQNLNNPNNVYQRQNMNAGQYQNNNQNINQNQGFYPQPVNNINPQYNQQPQNNFNTPQINQNYKQNNQNPYQNNMQGQQFNQQCYPMQK